MIFDVVYIFKENYEKKLSAGYVFFQKIIKFAAYERRIHTFAV